MTLHDRIVKILNDEGAASEGGWHSWRCFDKGRYPEPCRCTEEVAGMVVGAVLDAALDAVAALSPYMSAAHGDCLGRDDALAAIEALREEQK